VKRSSITYSHLRRAQDRVERDCQILIARLNANNGVAIVPVHEPPALIETAHLLSSPEKCEEIASFVEASQIGKG
jgi:hypothetical protein